MIRYFEENRIFQLDTANTTYAFGFLGDFAPVQIYYGKRVSKLNCFPDDLENISRSFSAEEPEIKGKGRLDVLPLDFSTFGNADLRLPTVKLHHADGTEVSRFCYRGHKIYKGKPRLSGLPATYVEQKDEADTLELELFDSLQGIRVTLIYTAFTKLDAITRSLRIENQSPNTANIKTALSATVDFTAGKDRFDLIHLDGSWLRERHVRRQALFCGNQEVYSRRGASSPHHNPFIALINKDAGELQGEVYGFNLVYSGNFTAGVEVDAYNTARVYMGLNPFHFNWKLEPGCSFQTPEVVMVYSDQGLSGMSRIYHKLYRTRLCRGKYRDVERFALINNWEATYFTFNEEKLHAIAKAGKELGLSLMVLDDGWFGKRDHDRCSLGDWVLYKEKLPHGLDGLANALKQQGMAFGLWFEPEMVSPDSDLYRAHPEWALHIPGRTASLGRNQLVLDLSRSDVCDYIINALTTVLNSADIRYVKWDMNRHMSEVGSELLPADQQLETAHRYMLGLYRVMETLVTRFSNILFESCSSGGGRFDPGMLYYMPQTWVSDCSDAGERMSLQYGTSICYPFSAMGAHVSAVPNHQVKNRSELLKTRCEVALPGQFGFELDLSKMTEEEKKLSRFYVAMYEKYGEVFHKGDLYRLRSPYEGNESILQFISEDESTVILCVMIKNGVPMPCIKRVRLAGLCEGAVYEDVTDIPAAQNDPCKPRVGAVYGGDELMNRGLSYLESGDFATSIRIFKKRNLNEV